MKNNFNILSIGKTERYVCSIEGMNTLTRTGTISESIDSNNSTILLSFYSSILFACNRKFLIENTDEKNQSIIELAKLVNKKYKTLPNALNNLDKVINIFLDYLKHLYTFLNSSKDDETDSSLFGNLENIIQTIIIEPNLNLTQQNVDIYKIIFFIISPNVGFEKILNFSKKRWLETEGVSLLDFSKIVMKETMRFFKYQDISDKIEDEKHEFIKFKILSLINCIFDIIMEEIPEDIESIAPSKLDTELLNLVSKHFKCRFFFIDYLLKYPITFSGYDHNNPQKAIFILSFNHKHYEIIGKCLDSNYIQREFLPNEDIVKFTLNYLNNETSTKLEENVII